MVPMKNDMEDINDFATEAARLITEEIDKEILESMISVSLVKAGWTASNVKAPAWPFDRPTWSTDTAAWCHMHCSGDYRMINGQWHFSLPEDATMFALKWA